VAEEENRGVGSWCLSVSGGRGEGSMELFSYLPQLLGPLDGNEREANDSSSEMFSQLDLSTGRRSHAFLERMHLQP